MHRRSTERSKNSSRSLSSSPARRGVPTSTCSFPCCREYAGAWLARPASVALLRAEHPRVLLELERSLVQEVLGDGVVLGRDRHRMANGGDRRRERRARAADRLGTVEDAVGESRKGGVGPYPLAAAVGRPAEPPRALGGFIRQSSRRL